jgi:hypothetical protein
MCVICGLQTGAKVTEAEFDEMWKSNPQGFGYAFVDGHNRIFVDKALELAEAKEKFFPHFEQFGDDSPFMLHFRIKTHGEKCLENTHPFKVNDRLVMSHNGVIGKCLPKGDDKRSDTRIFTEDLLRKLPDGFLHNTTITEFISDYIGGSKLAFLDAKRRMTIVNSHMGVKDGDRWFSNNSFRPYVSRPSNTSSVKPSTTYKGGTTTSPSSQQTVTPRSVAGQDALLKALDREATSCDVTLATPTKVKWDDAQVEAESKALATKAAKSKGAMICGNCTEFVSAELFQDAWGLCAACADMVMDFVDANESVMVVKDLWNDNGLLFPECFPLATCAGLNGKDTGGFTCVHYGLKEHQMKILNTRLEAELAGVDPEEMARVEAEDADYMMMHGILI